MLRYFRHKRLLDLFQLTETLFREDIYKIINEQLKLTIQSGARNNPSFRSRLESYGVKWFKFRGLEELESIPINTNPTLPPNNKYIKGRQIAMAAAFQRFLSWHGNYGKKVVWITPNKSRLLLSGLTRNSYIIPFTNNLGYIVQELQNQQNFILAARPAILSQLALYLQRTNNKTIQPDLIIAFNHDITQGAEKLLKRVFDCSIVRLISDYFYGSMIATCRYDYYHLYEPLSLHEILDESGFPVTSGRGRLVTTPLHIQHPELVRYNTGIEVIANKNSICPCGLSYRTVDALSYTTRPYIIGEKKQKLLLPLAEELHSNIVGVRYEQNFPGEVLISLLECEKGKYTPFDYREWFAKFWEKSIKILLIVDNRPEILGDSSLSTYNITTSSHD